jgi:amino acid transporter
VNRPNEKGSRVSKAGGLGILQLVAATYFMVAGGPYGLEELVSSVGYGAALLALVAIPLVWSLPTALVVGELASAVPQDGGYYVWVRRAIGPFWGFQEAWLSLAASIFDMAIYPTLFTLYLGRIWPAAQEGLVPIALGAGMMGVCAAWNIAGSRNVGRASVVMTTVLLAPFTVMVLAAITRSPPPMAGLSAAASPSHGVLTGLLIGLWNYMGWDNASTIAGEVHEPQRTYPRTMGIALALVTITYVVPVGAAAHAHIDPSHWEAGAWVDVAKTLVGPWLGWAVVLGGTVCGVGMFDALLMSYSRLPAALAEDGYLPRILARRHRKSGAPWVSIVVCCIVYTCSLGLGFQRLVELDILLYGASLVLEFVALVLLRIREPLLPRPFRIPGGLPGAIAIAVPPVALLGIALVNGAREEGGALALALGGALLASGPVLYLMRRTREPVGF